MSEQEKEILGQELSKEDLAEVTGGKWDLDHDECSNNHYRQMHLRKDFSGGPGAWSYVPFFPNCAATVEDGSWCGSNDACVRGAVVYVGMNDCTKAWR